MNALRFKRDDQDLAFAKVLRQRVDQYFREKQISKSANQWAVVKAMILFSGYIAAFLAIFFINDSSCLYGTYFLMGILTIFVALNIGHDAAHGAFSSNKKVNHILTYVFDLLGASGYLWQLKHVYSHHPHVNIPGMDGDIKQSQLVRIFPNSPFLWFHRYQYIYMPLLYFFYTLNWLLIRDFKDFFQTDISGKPNLSHPTSAYLRFFLGKLFFLARMIYLPYLLTSFSFGQILLGFIIFHFAASFTVALALISTHIGEHSIYPEPNVKGELPFSWIRHQLLTTTDFATQNRFITHFFGGFNHHLVHHIFPEICHIHYPEITKIIKATCQEYNMPYQENHTLTNAMLSHFRFLIKRSQQGALVEWPEI